MVRRRFVDIYRLSLVLVLSLFASACGDDGGMQVVPVPVLQNVTVAPATTTLAVDGTAALTATAHYDDGSTRDVTTDPDTAWSTSDSGIATVDVNGQVSAVGAGSTTVRAMFGGLTGDAGVTVTAQVAPTLTSIDITPSSPVLHTANETVTFAVTGHYSDGSSANVTSQATLTSAVPFLLKISGAVGTRKTANENPGIAVTATVGTLTAQARVIFVADIGSATLSASEDTTNCSVADNTGFWPIAASVPIDVTAGATLGVVDSIVSSDPNVIAFADSHIPLGEAKAAGSATVTITVGSMQTTVSISVQAHTLQSLQLVGPTSLNLGVTAQYRADGSYPNGSCDLAQGAMWSASPSTRASVIRGFARATTVVADAGAMNLTAMVGGFTGSLQVIVAGSCAYAFELRHNGPVMPVAGRFAELYPVVRFTDGSELNAAATQLSATTGDPFFFAFNVGTSPNIYIRTGSSNPGTVTLRAAMLTGGGVSICSDRAGRLDTDIDVVTLPAALTEIIVDCTSAPVQNLRAFDLTDLSVPAGLTQQCEAFGFFTDGSADILTDLVSWSSLSPSTADVSNSTYKGLVTANAPGTTVIIASVGTVSGASSFRVNTATPNGSLTPSGNVTVHKRIAKPYTVSVMYRIGATGPAQTYVLDAIANPASPVTCMSDATSIATIACGGAPWQVTGVATGTAHNTVMFKGLTATFNTIVDGAGLVSIYVFRDGTSSTSGSHVAGLDVPLQAFGLYGDATSFECTAEATWMSQNTSVVQVITPGVARGVASGTAEVRATFDGITGAYTFTTTP